MMSEKDNTTSQTPLQGRIPSGEIDSSAGAADQKTADGGNPESAAPLISVVVPVYNAETFLRDTVETIQRQTYPNLEILLVDDGSTDGSYALCQALAAEDHRIRCFTEENGGASRARNHGIRKAKGAYIGFVDSDDKILPDMYANLYEGAQKMERLHSSRYIIQIGRQEIDEEGNHLPDAVKAPEDYDLVPSVQFAESLLLYTGDASFCTALIPAAYMKEHPFTEGELGEDFSLLMKMVDTMDGVLRLPVTGYLVVHRKGSATRRANPSQFSKVYVDIVRHADDVEQRMVSAHPELAVAATRFGLFERLDYLLHVPIADMNSRNEFYVDVCAYLRRNFRAMWRNPFLTMKNKLYLTLLTIAPRKIRQLHWALRGKAIQRESRQ